MFFSTSKSPVLLALIGCLVPLPSNSAPTGRAVTPQVTLSFPEWTYFVPTTAKDKKLVDDHVGSKEELLDLVPADGKSEVNFRIYWFKDDGKQDWDAKQDHWQVLTDNKPHYMEKDHDYRSNQTIECTAKSTKPLKKTYQYDVSPEPPYISHDTPGVTIACDKFEM